MQLTSLKCRRVEDSFEDLISKDGHTDKEIVKSEDPQVRSKFGHGEIAYRTKVKKTKVALAITVGLFFMFECIILTLQYLDVAFSLSKSWHSAIYIVRDALSILNFSLTGMGYLLTVIGIATLNIPILLTILLLIWFRCIRILTTSRKSMILLIILIFPFFMSFGVFSVPIMKLLLQTYD